MNVVVLQKELKEALGKSVKFVANRAQLPILTNVLIKAQKASLIIEATNLEASFITKIGAKVIEDGELAVPGKLFFELITSIKSEQIELTSLNEVLHIKSDGINAKLPGMIANEFPKTDYSLQEDALEMKVADFAAILNKTLFSVSNDLSRPSLTGVYFIFTEEGLTAVSSDGSRLSKFFLKTTHDMPDAKVIIPKFVLSEIAKEDSDKTLKFSFNESAHTATFEINNSIIVSRVIEGSFPDFNKVIPKTSSTTISVSTNDLTDALSVVSIFARQNAGIIKMEIGEGSIKVISDGAKTGTSETKIVAKVVGEPLTISFNYRFIEEYIQTIKEDNLTIKLNDAGSPVLFEVSGESDFVHIVMPLRI